MSGLASRLAGAYAAPMRVLGAMVVLWALAGWGCAAGGRGDPTFVVAPGDYERAFDVAIDVLDRHRFEIDRVDAREGVLTTRLRSSAGIATPWRMTGLDAGSTLGDLLHRQFREVRITFEPEASAQRPESGKPQGAPPGPQATPLGEGGVVVGRVEVTVQRVARPGWRVETTSVRSANRTLDPLLLPREMWPSFVVPVRRDTGLASRLAASIREELARGGG